MHCIFLLGLEHGGLGQVLEAVENKVEMRDVDLSTITKGN